MAGQLTAIAAEAARSRSLNGAWKVRALLKVCSELASLDQKVERRKTNARRVLTGGIAGIVVSVILLFVVCFGMESFDLVWLPILLAVISVALVLWGQRLRNAAAAVDLANELGLFIVPMLQRLVADLDPDRKVRVNLNLRAMDPENPDQRLPSAGTSGGRGTTTVSLFSEPLGSLQLPLVNGNTLVLRLRNQFRHSVRNYRSASGKSKRKEKWKKCSRVTAVLIPKKPTATWSANRMKTFTEPVRTLLHFKNVEGITTVRLDKRFRFAGNYGAPPNDVVPVAAAMSLLVRLTAMAHEGIQGAESGR